MGTKQDQPQDAPAPQRWAETLPGEDAYRALVGNVTDYAIFLMDRHGTIHSWNAGAQAVYGHGDLHIIGHHFSMLYPADEVARGYPEQALQNAARLGRSEDEGWRLRNDGKRFWARTVVHALRDDSGTLYGFGEITRDLTEERKQAEALRRIERRSRSLKEEAMRDPLTGAFNRRHLPEFLRSAIERAAWATASLLAIDLNDFKQINDAHGHDVGDAVLIDVARLATQMLRGDDRLFRTGGDEFLVYLPGAGAHEARAIAQRLQETVASTALGELSAAISVGAAQLMPGDTVESWIQRADAAMYEAKRNK